MEKTYFHALNFIFRILFPSIKYIRINSWKKKERKKETFLSNNAVCMVYNYYCMYLNIFCIARRQQDSSRLYFTLSLWMFLVGLKRKFSFSYFRKNFAKIYYHFSRNNHTKIYENNKNFHEHWCENFRENENFYEHLCNNFTFWYNHILTRLFHNFLAEIFATIDAKMFAKTKIFAKQNFANFTKITSFSHDFRFFQKWKKPFSFQP
jgi:hypothetical protein